MVERRVTDGVRIAQLLASELDGHGGPLADVAVVEADPDVEPTVDGRLAYAVDRAGERLAEVYVHPERARVEFLVAPDRAAAAATDRGLRVRSEATDSPRTLVFVEDGAAVKRAQRTVEDVLRGSR